MEVQINQMSDVSQRRIVLRIKINNSLYRGTQFI